MSLYPFYKPSTEVNDFYDSIQGIQDTLDSNENFGKYVSTSKKGVPRTFSYKDMTDMAIFEQGTTANFSANSFQANNYDAPNHFVKKQFAYKLQDPSTKASLSSTSLTSQSAMPSTTSFVNTPTSCCQSLNSTVKVSNSSSNLNGEASAGVKPTNNKKIKGKGGRKRAGTETSFKQKYKTEVCKFWAQNGACNFGDQCAFAHGSVEMRQKSHVSTNYKTRKCNQFHETGYCPYGIRCQFVHYISKEIQSETPTAETAKYEDVVENAELWISHDPDCMCLLKRQRPRLPSFQVCTSDDNDNCEKETTNSSSENSLEHSLEALLL